MRRIADAFIRVAYRCAYPVMLAWWPLRHPPNDGAVVAVRLDRRVLMIRHSYRDILGWPGGGISRGETAAEAARRELAEELGLTVRPEALRFVGELVSQWEFRRDHVRVFELRLNETPALRLDNREVVAAQFMEPAAVLALPVIPPFIRAYLEKRLVSPSG